jgi:hypothetical protein
VAPAKTCLFQLLKTCMHFRGNSFMIFKLSIFKVVMRNQPADFQILCGKSLGTGKLSMILYPSCLFNHNHSTMFVLHKFCRCLD